MRVPLPDTTRPRAAAKRLVTLCPHVHLASAQQAIAHGLGYRDWHDLNAAATLDKSALAQTSDQAELARAVVERVSLRLGIDAGDAQFAILGARLFGSELWSLDHQLKLTTDRWRREFGDPARGRPGTMIRVTEDGRSRTRVGYLCGPGRASRVFYDSNIGHCAGFEVVTPRRPLSDFVPARLWLPYGYWVLQDGSQVIYSRDYLPMWRVRDGRVERLLPWWWINGEVRNVNLARSIGQADWHSGPVRQLAIDLLAKLRIHGLPKLVDAMTYIIREPIQEIGEAACWLAPTSPEVHALPSYARVNRRLPWPRHDS